MSGTKFNANLPAARMLHPTKSCAMPSPHYAPVSKKLLKSKKASTTWTPAVFGPSVILTASSATATACPPPNDLRSLITSRAEQEAQANHDWWAENCSSEQAA